MWLGWFPWRWILRKAALRSGFLDPFWVLSRLQRFSQPSEVAAPTELLRSGAVMHARGLINSQAIQHNLDWIWPYWVERQYDPEDESFVPRAFSATHINLTHRNWTAVGLPDLEEWPLVDPRGLVTPFYDGWSLDFWIVHPDRPDLIPSKLRSVQQELLWEEGLKVRTEVRLEENTLLSEVEGVEGPEGPELEIRVTAASLSGGCLAVNLRPYNPEGVSFIHEAESVDGISWKVNGNQRIVFDQPWDKGVFSTYAGGDAYNRIFLPGEPKASVRCDVGMITASALFALPRSGEKNLKIRVPYPLKRSGIKVNRPTPSDSWRAALEGTARMRLPENRYTELFEIAKRTLILHSPAEVFPGPFTYRRFWFRDAAFILDAMLGLGMTDRVRRALWRYPERQTPSGYFLSQEGEWDSNGESLWILGRYFEVTREPLSPRLKNAAYRAAEWIRRKRLPEDSSSPHGGLLPAGFSAEHLGPNDYYYWDDFWAAAGLDAVSRLARGFGDAGRARRFKEESEDFLRSIDRSLALAEKRIGRPAIPASPHRRLDAGAIGSIAASYPLKLWENPAHPKILDTARFLMNRCFVNGGFFQDMTHSGINPYLTLHIAQVLLRAGDEEWKNLVRAVADLSSPTGQWPEAVHPRTGGGCMGDGQHVWAAAEWVLMMRALFVIEEPSVGLVIGAGIGREWLSEGADLFFGPTPTVYGPVSVRITSDGERAQVTLRGRWHAGAAPNIEVRLKGKIPVDYSLSS